MRTFRELSYDGHPLPVWDDAAFPSSTPSVAHVNVGLFRTAIALDDVAGL
jgi:hypothetical protein